MIGRLQGRGGCTVNNRKSTTNPPFPRISAHALVNALLRITPSPHPRDREATTASAVTTSYFCNTSLDLTPTKRSSDTKPLTTYSVFRAHFHDLHAFDIHRAHSSFFLKYIRSFFIDFFEKSGILRMRALPATYVEGFHDLEAVKTMKYQPLGRTGMDVSKLSFGKVVSESFNQMQKC